MFPRQNHGRYAVSDSGTLTINPVRKEDAGEYECQALSVAGSALAKANIEVRGTVVCMYCMCSERNPQAGPKSTCILY